MEIAAEQIRGVVLLALILAKAIDIYQEQAYTEGVDLRVDNQMGCVSSQLWRAEFSRTVEISNQELGIGDQECGSDRQYALWITVSSPARCLLSTYF